MANITSCLTEAITAIRRSELDDEAKQYAESLLDSVRRMNVESVEVRIAKAIGAANEVRKSTFIAQVTNAKEELAAARFDTWLSGVPENQRAAALSDFIEHPWRYVDSDNPSLSKLIRGEERFVLGRAAEVLERMNGNRPWLSDSAHALDVARAMVGEVTENAQAIKDAATLRSTMFEYLDRLRKAGVWVGQMDGWLFQSHSPSRIMANRDEWTAFMRENLDPTFHPDAETSADHIFRSLITRDLINPTDRPISMRREVHFRTPEAQIEYMMRFGEGTIVEQMQSSLRGLARNTILAEQVSPHPSRTMNRLLNNLQQEARARGDVEAERAAGRAIPTFQSITGELYNPANANVAHWGRALRGAAVFTLMGKTVISAVAQDSLTAILRGALHRSGVGRSAGGVITNMVRLMSDEQRRAYARSLGVWGNALHAASADRYYTVFQGAEQAANWGQKAAQTTMRITGMTAFDQTIRSATMLTMVDEFSNVLRSGANLDRLSPRYRQILRANGIDDAQLNAIRNSASFTDLDMLDINSLSPDLRGRVLAFLFREVDIAVVYPDHYSRALLQLGGRAGTFPGELSAGVTQFLSWPISFIRGPFMAMMAAGKAPFAAWSTAMLAGGIITTQLYEAVSGRPMFEWDSEELWRRSFARSGLLTPIGEQIVNSLYGQDPDLGPVAGLASTGFNTIGAASAALIEGDTDKAAARVVRAARQVALPNWWWLEPISATAVDSVLWELDPDYMRDRERRFRQEGRMH